MPACAAAKERSVSRVVDGPGRRTQRTLEVLNTLDRIDDPAVRALVRRQFEAQTKQSLDQFIATAPWYSKRDREQAQDMVSDKRDKTEGSLAELHPEHGRTLREWGNEGQLDQLPLRDALHYEGMDREAIDNVFQKAVKNDPSASVAETPTNAGLHHAHDGTPLAVPLSDHPDALTREELTLLADIHGRRSDHIHPPYTTSAGRELPGTEMRNVVPEADAEAYRTGKGRYWSTPDEITVGGFVGPKSTTAGQSAETATVTLGLDYEGSPFVTPDGAAPSDAVKRDGIAAVDWNLNSDQHGKIQVPFGTDTGQYMREYGDSLHDSGAYVPVLYERTVDAEGKVTYPHIGHRDRVSANDPGTGFGYSAHERLVGPDGERLPVTPSQEHTLNNRPKLPEYEVSQIRPEAELEPAKQVSDSKRNNELLTPEEIEHARARAIALGMPPEDIVISSGDPSARTSWGRAYGQERLFIADDLKPAVPHKDRYGEWVVLTPNQRVSADGALGHEIVGHREADNAGQSRTQDYEAYAAMDPDTRDAQALRDNALDEAQASLRAAKFTPGLSKKERMVLFEDAMARLAKVGLSVDDVRSLGLYLDHR